VPRNDLHAIGSKGSARGVQRVHIKKEGDGGFFTKLICAHKVYGVIIPHSLFHSFKKEKGWIKRQRQGHATYAYQDLLGYRLLRNNVSLMHPVCLTQGNFLTHNFFFLGNDRGGR